MAKIKIVELGRDEAPPEEQRCVFVVEVPGSPGRISSGRRLIRIEADSSVFELELDAVLRRLPALGVGLVYVRRWSSPDAEEAPGMSADQAS